MLTTKESRKTLICTSSFFIIVMEQWVTGSVFTKQGDNVWHVPWFPKISLLKVFLLLETVFLNYYLFLEHKSALKKI